MTTDIAELLEILYNSNDIGQLKEALKSFRDNVVMEVTRKETFWQKAFFVLAGFMFLLHLLKVDPIASLLLFPLLPTFTLMTMYMLFSYIMRKILVISMERIKTLEEKMGPFNKQQN